jgi:hypothetical protein
MLDGTNVLLGVDQDLYWVDATQQELVRRFAEVAHLMLHAGLIVVSTTNAIGLADYGQVQALIPDFASVVIDVDPSWTAGPSEGPAPPATGSGEQSSPAPTRRGTSAAPCDLRIRGTEPEPEVVAQVVQLLKARGITAV